MTEAVIAALITGACAIISELVISHNQSQKLFAELDKHNAVTDTKLDELTREVREHNNFAKRMPVLEEKVAQLEREKKGA